MQPEQPMALFFFLELRMHIYGENWIDGYSGQQNRRGRECCNDDVESGALYEREKGL